MINLLYGDCLDVLRTLPDNSVDAIVTDPPYGLSFMGKKWDYDVPSEAIWRECLRVLKPGGHLLAFAGTRTQHRMAVRIEDAGFEIRDMIAWVYGSGFPKSLDVSKAIDKQDAAEAQQARRYRFTEWVRSTGLTAKQIDHVTGTCMGSHYTTHPTQPAIMTRKHLDAVRHMVGEVPEWVEREADKRTVESENMKRREVVGERKQRANGAGSLVPMNASAGDVELITAPATDAARQWQGWGTALKPALEPVTVARKPLVGTVAENVLAHGTGALNVDGCRVAGEPVPVFDTMGGRKFEQTHTQPERRTQQVGTSSAGRWPANLIHDGSEEVVDVFAGTPDWKCPDCGHGQNSNHGGCKLFGAARFFYCAKASKRDRDEGLEGFEAQRATFAEGTGLRKNGDGTPRNQDPSNKNFHPTVKPTDLMRYLCRLVTPPGGIVLDPFMGSGSTGKAAMLEGFQFIGIEREAEYLEIARARINSVQPNLL